MYGCLDNLDKMITESDDLYDIAMLYQFKGKDFYYSSVYKRDIKSIINETIFRECKALVNLMDIDVSPSRVKLIVKSDSKPKTNDEKFIANIKHMLTVLADKIDMFEVNDNQILNLANLLLYGISKVDYGKNSILKNENLIQIEETESKREYIKRILGKYSSVKKRKENELINLISALYVDYRKTEPFNKYNEIINLFFLYSMLYSEAFNMFKYVSFFEIYNLHKDEFEEAYLASQVNWEKGYASARPLARVIRRMLIEGYQAVDNMIRSKEINNTNQKTNIIEYTILNKLPEVFSKEMIKSYHPDASKATIDRTLARLRDEDKIRPTGTGRSAKWMRIVKVERFDRNNVQQFNLYDYMNEQLEKDNEE